MLSCLAIHKNRKTLPERTISCILVFMDSSLSHISMTSTYTDEWRVFLCSFLHLPFHSIPKLFETTAHSRFDHQPFLSFVANKTWTISRVTPALPRASTWMRSHPSTRRRQRRRCPMTSTKTIGHHHTVSKKSVLWISLYTQKSDSFDVGVGHGTWDPMSERASHPCRAPIPNPLFATGCAQARNISPARLIFWGERNAPAEQNVVIIL